MHLNRIAGQDRIPDLVRDLAVPLVHGPAALAHLAFAGSTLADLLGFLGKHAASLDLSMAHQLCFDPVQATALQDAALAQACMFRIIDGPAPRSARPFRLLALVAPGNLMVNTPLDFITRYLDVQLDLLFLIPGQALPRCIPDHDAAFFAISESDPAALRRLVPLHAAWPRPVLNNPAAVARLSRDRVADGLAGQPGLCSPPAALMPRQSLAAYRPESRLEWPVIIRPAGSHAGHGLERADDADALQAYLAAHPDPAFFVTKFIDYRNADGLFRKFRLAMIDGRALLCHMAASGNWMIHYLNAGMAEDASRRDAEARAMQEFDTGFATRHATALTALNRFVGLDYYQVDCAETPDGQLLVFELDVAAIIHLMDPPALYPYKPAQMRRVFEAFGTMLRHRAGWPA